MAAIPDRPTDSAGAPAAATSTRRLAILLGVEVILIAVLRIPYDLGFTAFAFGDRGSWMTVMALVAQGRRPTIDFGYPYGLLPIWLGSGWFHLCGTTPRAYQAANLMLGLAMAWAIARIVHALRLPFVAIVMVIIALPFAIQSSYPSLAHALEATLICCALAEQAAGRRRFALALATAACFVKPSMGYVYGFVLMVWMAADFYWGARRKDRLDWHALWHELRPAVATTLALGFILGWRYGPAPLLATILPLTGMKDYVAFNFGFFHGIGRDFWYGTPVLFYFGSVIAFWFAASIGLALCGLIALGRLLRGSTESAPTRDEVVISTAVLHVVFLTMFFAGPTSWSYYSYILVIGAAACCTAARYATSGAWLLVALAASGQTSTRTQDMIDWKVRAPSAATAGLWASAEQHDQWREAVSLIDGQRAALLSSQGCAPLLFPEFERNSFAYLTPGIALPHDLDLAL
ncbi:MAG TPA: hypothetical protein VN742_08995, partial [Candidatus Binataceae bacterium]|nr:hypothetical protein [Candidatus Binataceae bacterium]